VTLEEAVPIFGVLVPVLGGVDFLIRKWLQKHRDELVISLNRQVADLHADVNRLTGERDTARNDHAAAVQLQVATAADLVAETNRAVELADDLRVSDAQLLELGEVKEALDKKQKTHDNRIRRALKMEGAIWTQPVMAGTPPFRPLVQRRTPVVSVLNLKGGVGKTTLTAYLAWALSTRGYRVLLVDLDLQGSLSSLFLRNDELARLGNEEKLFQHFLAGAMQKEAPKLLSFAVPVPQLNKHCRLVAASDRLAYVELSQTVRWLLRVGGTQQWNGRHDGRMILRRALHTRGLSKKFDVILLDCPPLINLCCANALAASDYVLTPVTPSLKAIERVTPLLKRVMEVRENGVNPKLTPLGVVVNRVEGRALSPREEDLFVNLPDECVSVYQETVYRFDTVIQQRVAVQESEGCFEPPTEGHPLLVTFEALAEEFVKRLPKECRTPDERQRGTRAKGGGL
jgi:cellulose biosynthesis protein BcsQ